MSTLPTTEKLARAIEAAAEAHPDKPQMRMMAGRARNGYYDDFKSLLATPCIQLVRDLDALGCAELSARAKNGEFDATKEESDAWAASPAGQATFNELLKGGGA
jgi:hypothetical protein